MAEPTTETHEEHGEHGAAEEMTRRGAQAASALRDGLIGGVHGAQMVVSEGVHMVRDVATDTVRAAGDVSVVAVGATRNVLVGVADGVRDVLAHIIPFRMGRGEEHGERKEH